MGSPGAYTSDGYRVLGSLERLHREVFFLSELLVLDGSSTPPEAGDVSVDTLVAESGVEVDSDRLPTVKVRFNFSRKGILDDNWDALERQGKKHSSDQRRGERV